MTFEQFFVITQIIVYLDITYNLQLSAVVPLQTCAEKITSSSLWFVQIVISPTFVQTYVLS